MQSQKHLELFAQTKVYLPVHAYMYINYIFIEAIFFNFFRDSDVLFGDFGKVGFQDVFYTKLKSMYIKQKSHKMCIK